MPMTRSHGFTLIEALIALVILAIGLLGMATLMMNSLQSSQGAAQRSAATVAAYDLVERMRANRNSAIQASSPYAVVPSSGCTPTVDTCLPCRSKACTAGELASADMSAWFGALRTAIPDAAATIQQNPGNAGNDTFCIAIFWQEPGLGAATNATICGTNSAGRSFYQMRVII